MSRHKKRMHKTIGKFQDRSKDRKARLNSKNISHRPTGRTMKRPRNRKTAYLIGRSNW